MLGDSKVVGNVNRSDIAAVGHELDLQSLPPHTQELQSAEVV